MRVLLSAVLFVLLLVPVGCSAPVQHPGSVNLIDSQLYDTLLTLQSGIEEAKVQFAGNAAARAPLNKIIASYSAAQDAYKAWHAAGAGDASALTLQINAVKSDLASLIQLFGGAK